MAILPLNASIFVFIFVSFFIPFVHPLSTVAISETGNQTLICAISGQSSQFLNCTSFPGRNPVSIVHPSAAISGIVAGNGFLCTLNSSYSKSILFCWRFSTVRDNMIRKRIYNGTLISELRSGNSVTCGVINGSNSLQCWPRRSFDYNLTQSGDVISSSLAVGDEVLLGLTSSGKIRCIGRCNSSTHIGNFSTRIGNFSEVKVGFGYACGVHFNGELNCWSNVNGEIQNTPSGVFKSVALGENRFCAIMVNGTVICWGESGFSLPEPLTNHTFISVEAKRRIFCGIPTNKFSLVCWGNGDLDSNPLVFSQVVPGPCRARNQCLCDDVLPGYGSYCPDGLVICLSCVKDANQTSPVPPAVAPAPVVIRDKKWTRRMVAFMVVGCVGCFSSLLVVCVFLFRRYLNTGGSRVHDSGRLDEEVSPQEGGQMAQTQTCPSVLEKKFSHLISMGGQLEEFTLDELAKATDNFSDDNKIGTGSFGSVYLAVLDDGRRVAIKRAETSASSSHHGDGSSIRRSLQDKDHAFVTELEFLSRLNHKNLVRLLGYCEESGERVLVYEYMENGTLSDHLHKLDDSYLALSWATRIKVALDAARGIEYLHEYATPRLIHRDIKSSNILLDGKWTAKVSDFGLSLIGPPDDETHLSRHAAGTVGYMDPEYYRLQLLTSKSDVYSFGVVMLELLSGRKAIHKIGNGTDGARRNVVEYVAPYIIRDEVHRVLDRRVPPPTPIEIEAVAYVGYLAVDCVMPEGRDRPTMREVVSCLERALEACVGPAPPMLSPSTTNSST